MKIKHTSKGMEDSKIYAVMCGYNDILDFPNRKHRFDSIFVVKSTLRRAQMAKTSILKDESSDYDYMYIIEFDCALNPNNVGKNNIVPQRKQPREGIWVITGRNGNSHTDLKIVAVFRVDCEKEAKDFVNNMSSEMKAELKQQYGVDTFSCDYALYDK